MPLATTERTRIWKGRCGTLFEYVEITTGNVEPFDVTGTVESGSVVEGGSFSAGLRATSGILNISPNSVRLFGPSFIDASSAQLSATCKRTHKYLFVPTKEPGITNARCNIRVEKEFSGQIVGRLGDTDMYAKARIEASLLGQRIENIPAVNLVPVVLAGGGKSSVGVKLEERDEAPSSDGGSAGGLGSGTKETVDLGFESDEASPDAVNVPLPQVLEDNLVFPVDPRRTLRAQSSFGLTIYNNDATYDDNNIYAMVVNTFKVTEVRMTCLRETQVPPAPVPVPLPVEELLDTPIEREGRVTPDEFETASQAGDDQLGAVTDDRIPIGLLAPETRLVVLDRVQETLGALTIATETTVSALPTDLPPGGRAVVEADRILLDQLALSARAVLTPEDLARHRALEAALLDERMQRTIDLLSTGRDTAGNLGLELARVLLDNPTLLGELSEERINSFVTSVRASEAPA